MKTRTVAVVKNYEGYPVLKTIDCKEYVVLFIDPNKGIVVHATSSSHFRLGYYCETWSEEIFTVYDGEIHMTNS